MPDYVTHTDFRARDNVSQVYDRMGRSADQYADRASNAFKRVNHDANHHMKHAAKAGYTFGSVFKGMLAAQAVQSTIGAVTGGIGKAISEFLNFDDVMVGAAVRFDDIGLKSQNFGRDLDDLKLKTRELAVGTKYSQTDIANGMAIFAESGWKWRDAIGAMPVMVNAATAANEDLMESTKQNLRLMSGFNLVTDDSASNIRNLTGLTNMLTKAAIDANGGWTDLYENLKVSGPIFTASGETPQSIISLATVLQNAGFGGEMGATAMKSMKVRMYRPDIQQVLGALGIRVDDPKTGKMRKTFDVLKDLQPALRARNIPKGGKVEGLVAYTLFGMYGIAGSQKIMEALAQVEEEEKRVYEASRSNIALDMRKKIQDYSMMAKIGDLTHSVFEKVFQVFDKFESGGKKGIDGLIQSVREFDVTSLVGYLRILGDTIKVVWMAVKPLMPLLPYIVGGFLAWKAAITGWNIAKLVAGFYELFMVVMATPLGPILVAVGALIGLIIILEKKFHLFSDAWKYWKNLVVNDVIPAVVKAWDWVGDKLTAVFSSLFSLAKFMFNPIASLIGLNDPATFDAMMRGFGGGQAPNTKEAEARQSRFTGRLDISGAPAGATITSTVLGAPSFDVNLLGAN